MEEKLVDILSIKTSTLALLIINASLLVAYFFLIIYLWQKKRISEKLRDKTLKIEESENENNTLIPSGMSPTETIQDSNLIPSEHIYVEGSDDTRLVQSEISEGNLIPSESLVIIRELGTGSTSTVSLANYINRNEDFGQVAAKALKHPLNITDFLNEIKFLSACKHSNIVSFINWMESEGQTYIITEFMGGGDLHTYLSSRENVLNLKSAFSYISQILDAMVYLSHKHILHRDLAARNCLLNETHEMLKINDFGLSREMDMNYEYITSANRALPLKWLPLEIWEPNPSDFRIYTKKVDIWSFAILVWEIFERGKDFYEGLSRSALYNFLKTNHRLKQPQNCPDELYNIMLSCWDENYKKRPSFDFLQENIMRINQEIQMHKPKMLDIPITFEYSNGYEYPRQSS